MYNAFSKLTIMSEKNSKNASNKSTTDWDRLAAMEDAEIDYSDIPAQPAKFFKDAELRMPEPKQTVTIRLDSDVLNWFKAQGKGYQTRINAVLRMYIDAQQHPHS